MTDFIGIDDFKLLTITRRQDILTRRIGCFHGRAIQSLIIVHEQELVKILHLIAKLLIFLASTEYVARCLVTTRYALIGIDGGHGWFSPVVVK
ncbi:MAG TPA: hypothetical protein DCS21_05590 [Gammaproteobacteria bacterium]|nr:hypothetical protein [Gammaproteobacteria bacterium]